MHALLEGRVLEWDPLRLLAQPPSFLGIVLSRYLQPLFGLLGQVALRHHLAPLRLAYVRIFLSIFASRPTFPAVYSACGATSQPAMEPL